MGGKKGLQMWRTWHPGGEGGERGTGGGIVNILGVRIRIMLATFLRDITAATFTTFLSDITVTFLSVTDMYVRTNICTS